MKPINLSLAILLLFSGCSKLEEDPASYLTTDQFYQDEKQALAAANGAYRKLYESGQSLYNSLIQIGVEMAADDYAAGPRARNAHVRAIAGLTHDASNDRMEQLWRQSYDAINASNLVVDRVAQIPDGRISASMRSRIVHEARFLRALHYFNLVRWFGPVPLVLHETTTLKGADLYVEKASEEAVYGQIIEDLKAAEALPRAGQYGAADVGRATAGAAKSLLAKVYLTRHAWQLAADKSREVIESGDYALFTNFADVFQTATKNGIEHIFSAQFRGNFNYQGNSLASRSAPATIPGINGDYADALNRAAGLYESFADNDHRKSVTFITQMVSPADGKTYNVEPHFFKYYDPAVVGNQGQSSKNLPIIRYAEVLLVYAEALNEASGAPTAQAYWAIDEVRRRAGIAPLQDIAPALSQAQFRDSVFQERRKELVYEHQRWFDLVRRGADYYVATLKASGKNLAAPKHLHFPTPQRELNLNSKLTQHPDWR